MPKPRKSDLIQCVHFLWRLFCRDGWWYADGRSNQRDVGRHSLGTDDKDEARRLLMELDTQRAVELGLIARPPVVKNEAQPLALAEGRRLYEDHLGRSRVAGGVRASTRKRYKPVFDKFAPFAKSIGIESWNSVDRDVLLRYADLLE